MTEKEKISFINKELDNIGRSAPTTGKTLACPEIMAVSKFRTPAEVQAFLQAGLSRFGENRVQEAADKWPALKQVFPHTQLHLIGPLQTNKVRAAVELFDMIETLDRPKLAAALASEMAKQDRFLPCLIQVNTGLETQKSGLDPREVPDFLDYCQSELGLDIKGLMGLPPLQDNPAPHFALLQTMARRLNLPVLSMGTSHDYQTAARFGASWVRLGTILFGPRPAL